MIAGRVVLPLCNVTHRFRLTTHNEQIGEFEEEQTPMLAWRRQNRVGRFECSWWHGKAGKSRRSRDRDIFHKDDFTFLLSLVYFFYSSCLFLSFSCHFPSLCCAALHSPPRQAVSFLSSSHFVASTQTTTVHTEDSLPQLPVRATPHF